MNSRRGFKVEIFMAEGRPDGLRLVKKSNWIGQGIVCPRGRYPEAKKRHEFLRSGVYLLVGQDGEQLPKLYVGEAEEVKNRLDLHYANKDFWQQAIVFTTKGTALNKAQVKYLEAGLLELAKACGRAKVQNKVKSHAPKLSEADRAEMAGYLDELLSLLPVLGVPFFERDEVPSEDRKVYHLKGPGCKATGIETNTGFTVLKGSLAREPTVPSMKDRTPGYYHLRQDLIGDGVLDKNADGYRFTKDWPFGSPSAAAAVCVGRAANGLTEWKDESGNTLKANREMATGA